MKFWEIYIKEKMNSDLWGFIALDYYNHQKSEGGQTDPSHFIDNLIESLPPTELNLIKFHNVLLSICVQLLGNDFNDIMDKSVKFLKKVNTLTSDDQVKQIVSQYIPFGKQENFRKQLESSGLFSESIQTNKVIQLETNSSTEQNSLGEEETDTELVGSDLTKNIVDFLKYYYMPDYDKNNQREDEKYQLSFSGDHKGMEVEKFLNSISKLKPEKLIYVSIGGADGSEVEYIMRAMKIKHAVLIEYSDYGANVARKRSEELSKEGFNLIVFQGDAMQRLNDCSQALLELKKKYNLNGVVLSFQAVLHELSNRSPLYDPHVLFSDIFKHFNIRIFHSREPTFANNWKDKVHIKIGTVPGSILCKIAQQINDVHHFNSKVDELADGFVQMNPNLATEILFKILYCKDLNRYKYEMGEKLTSFDPEKFSDILSRYIKPKVKIEISYQSTETFKQCYFNYGVEAKTIEDKELPLPHTFVTLTGYQN